MRKIALTLSTLFIFFLTTGQINVDSNGDVTIGNTYDSPRTLDVDGDTYINGNVGIGTTPITGYDLSVGSWSRPYSNALYVYGFTEFDTDYNGIDIRTGPSQYDLSILPEGYSGTVGSDYQAFDEMWAYDYKTPSDGRRKENIRDIDNALDKVLQLNPVMYDFKKEYRYQDSIPYSAKEIARIEKKRKDIFGFIAQDVEKIIPSVVSYNDSTDNYGMSYIKIIPLLAGAIKEQQSIISNLSNQLELLQQELINSELKKSGALDVDSETFSDAPMLYQNNPNPFSEKAIIKYNLPDAIKEASIIVYDMTGKQLKRIPLYQSGESIVRINGGEMDPGMYMYSMIVENQLIDTKQMILTTN